MIVYRLSKTLFANDLTGEGARLHGGRWNHIGTACVYASASRALAVLEYTVNINIGNIPKTLSMVSLEIPNDDHNNLTIGNLPGNWTDTPAPRSTKNFGTALLIAAKNPIIRIPSAVIQEEFNYIINPLHPGSRLIRILDITDIVYDIRIKS